MTQCLGELFPETMQLACLACLGVGAVGRHAADRHRVGRAASRYRRHERAARGRAKETSAAVKPVTGSLNVVVKLMGATLVGSTWPIAWVTVTDGGVGSQVTEWSPDVDAALGLPAGSAAALAEMDATTVPGVVIPVTVTVYVRHVPDTDATSVPPTVEPAKEMARRRSR